MLQNKPAIRIPLQKKRKERRDKMSRHNISGVKNASIIYDGNGIGIGIDPTRGRCASRVVIDIEDFGGVASVAIVAAESPISYHPRGDCV